ncbi:MAG: PEGA domain-containing protein [Candidatus Omnitrophota bacterium]
MQLLRKIFFYIFTTIYVVCCPLLLLYAFGYIYKPGPEAGIVETGLIYLSTAPPGAAIYVDSVQWTEKTPSAVRELLPGKYSVRMTLPDYTTWEEDVPVEAEKATVLDKVLLIPVQWESKALLLGRWQEIIPVRETDFFLASPVKGKASNGARNGPTAGDVLTCDYQKEEARPLLGPESPYREYTILSYFITKESPAVLLRVALGKREKFLWVQLAQDKNIVNDVTELFPEAPSGVKWTPDQTHLFVFRGGHLDRVDVSSGAIYPEYIRNVRGYGLSNGNIYVLSDDGTLQRMDYDKKSTKVLLDDPSLAESIFGKEGFFKIEVLSDDLILFLGEKGQLLANRLPYRFAGEGVRGIELFPKLHRVLIWEKDRIGILDFETEETGAVDFEKGPTLTWIYDKGKDIRQAFLAYDASHVLFLDSDSVFLIEIEEFGEFKINEVFRVKEKSAIFYSESTGKMYFLDRDSGELLSVTIVPEQGVIGK